MKALPGEAAVLLQYLLNTHKACTSSNATEDVHPTTPTHPLAIAYFGG